MSAAESLVLGIRHAQSTGNANPDFIQGRSNHLNITPLGERQAALVGPWLKRTYGTPDAIVASPAVRTRRTAEIALEAAGLQLAITIHDGLQELSQGEWEGVERSKVMTPAVQEQMAANGMHHRNPGGESFRDVQVRVRPAVETLPEGVVWMVTHGLALRCLAGDIERWGRDEILQTGDYMFNTSVTEIGRSENGLHLGRFALTEHLPPDLLTT